VIRFPEEKDLSDGEAAIGVAIEEGANDITIEGTLGERTDHLLSTYHLLRMVPETIDARLHIGNDTISLLGPGKHSISEAAPIISILPMTLMAKVRTEGLKYALIGEEIALGSTRGIHNEPASVQPMVEVIEGYVFLILCSGNGK
jgi:thiamine pyrophosphokinase